MSSLNILDNGQSLNISTQDTTKLVLISTARMETALSKLIGTIADGLLLTSQVCGFDKHFFLSSVLNMNKAVDGFLINAIKLQMLLQLRIDYILRVFDTMPGIKAEDSHAAGIQATEHNPPCPVLPEHPTEAKGKCKYSEGDYKYSKGNYNYSEKDYNYSKEDYKYSLKGRGVGLVSAHCDPFYKGIAIIQAYINHIDKNSKDNFLCYSVHKGNTMWIFSAFPTSVKIKLFSGEKSKKAIVEGTGSIVYKERYRSDNVDTASFILTIRYEDNESKGSSFQIAIKPDKKPDFCHDSGEISLESPSLIIETAGGNSTNSYLGFNANEEFKLANDICAEAKKIQSVLEELKDKVGSKYTTSLEELINLLKRTGQIINQALIQEMNLGI
ncbi:MAG TPA: hypothetical protein GXX14_07060 [Clostridiaceae bacterium]|nr:hypothetical protein [Clostridiaceae bacterium]